ncbi:MAG: DUF4328 domain-containing protein [Flavobacteriales bacterium]|nr:DUF4328 domain-containing protein [Flavobacteriales bacterium]
MESSNVLDTGFGQLLTLRPNKSKAKMLLVTLWINFGFLFLTIMLHFFTYFTASRGYTGMDAHAELLSIYSVLFAVMAFFTAILTIIIIIFWIQWMRRAYFNLHQLKTLGLQFSEGWAAGGWFVPIAFFWIPVQIMMSIWTKTQDHVVKDKRLLENGSIVVIWWLLFWASRILASVLNVQDTSTLFIQMNQYNMNEHYDSLAKDSITSIAILVMITVPLTGVAISMIRKSMRMQDFLYRKERGEEITNSMISGD